MDVTTWYLEQTDPADLRPARPPQEPVEISRAEVPSPEFGRFLYTAVGGDWQWTERLPWTWRRWMDWLDRPGTETWVAWLRGTPAGYAELVADGDGQVEIASFGLLPYAIGRGLGGHLLETAASRAWDIARRVPGLAPTRRVWVHTCSLDGPAALPNYRARGFRVYDERLNVPGDADEGSTPGPWPGAGPRG
ncbi:GNAT family N-acetyltransferase [Microbispora sp. RL4-1S]|uniref:GNAT family N-acetyltransferase n=1 Tax=Microbispora oryzae TaxID=2806554 RepID=A0A941AKX6_9ACTN|nr:GNAT family N-acetyltransferase [Microbispora oryzae]MBP2706587.1 GNAT family N-acetyltransferase [Microbispora oryzae]